MASTVDVLTAAYAGFNQRDIEAVLALMSADVDWPNTMDHVRIVGKDAVRTYWAKQWTVVDPQVDPLRITEDENGRAVVDVHQVVRDLGGKVLFDGVVQHVYAIQDGLIVRMDVREAQPVG